MAYQLKKEILLDASRSLVWKTYRDHLPELAVVMPTVESITVVDRQENNEIVLENIWKLTGSFLAIKKLVLENYFLTVMWLPGKKRLDFVSLRKHQLMGVICMCV